MQSVNYRREIMRLSGSCLGSQLVSDDFCDINDAANVFIFLNPAFEKDRV
jgi:hypothetical protein